MREETVVRGTPMTADISCKRQLFLKAKHECFAIDGLQGVERVRDAVRFLRAGR